ncbi:MAG: hypothetical protein WAT79_16940 [Saprospiraceae bacterium]
MKYLLLGIIAYFLLKSFFPAKPSGLHSNQPPIKNNPADAIKQDGEYVEYEDVTDEK